MPTIAQLQFVFPMKNLIIKFGGPVTGNTGEIQHPAGVTISCYSKPFYLKNAGCVNRRIYHGKLSVQRDRSLNLTQQSLWQYPKKTFHLGPVVPWCTPSIGFHPSPSLTIPGVKAGSSQECLTRVGVQEVCLLKHLGAWCRANTQIKSSAGEI